MGIRNFIEKLKDKKRFNSEQLKAAITHDRIQTVVEERKKSSNERELERFMEEDRQESIKNALTEFRKRREHDINFGHNPLDVPNITNHTDFEILKEKNQFAGRGNMFMGQKNIFVNKKRNHNGGNLKLI